MQERSIQALYTELVDGNNRSLEFIFVKYADACVRQLQRQTYCNLQEAEDIFVDAVMIFRENVLAGKVQHLGNLRGYLYTICANQQRERHRQRMREEEQKKEIGRTMCNKNYVESNEEQEEMTAVYQNRMATTLEAFHALGEKCRKVLYHYYVDGMRMQEIAAKLGYANADVAKAKKSQCYRRWVNRVKEIQNPS